MSRWSFRFLLWYICILCVQPQNRFTFLHPLHIADLCIMAAVGLHILSANAEGRPIIRMGPATITAFCLMFFSFLSLKVGVMQTNHAWNSDIDIIFKNCTVLILVEAMAFSTERVWAVYATLMLSTIWWLKGGVRLALAGATVYEDRIMGPAVSIIENPNGFAYMLTVMIPVYLYFFQKGTNRYQRWGFLFMTLVSVWLVMKTGSRTGMLALIMVAVFLLPKYGAQHKMAIVLAAVSITIFSSSIGAMNMARFKSIPASIASFLSSEDDVDPAQMDRDEQSAWERKMKNKQTWKLIKTYPLFGVGIQSNDKEILEDEELHYAAGQVHNEILYAGKQMGFIGIALYLSLMGTIFFKGRAAEKALRTSWPVAADLGWTMKMQAVVFAVGGFFSPIPWNPIYLIIAGAASALWGNLRERPGGLG